MRIKGSHIIAALLAIGIGLWMMTGEVEVGGRAANAEAAKPIAERETEKASELFKVRYFPLRAEQRTETILVRGRTKANAVVTVRAETSGVLLQRLVAKGDRVEKGQKVCVLDKGAREAQLAQARAQLLQAETDYKANVELRQKGFAAENRINQLRAGLDAAKAAVAASELELSRVEVTANASGIVQDPIAEVGEMLNPGGTCITLIDNDPMLFTGQVSEREIGKLKTGMTANVELVGGEMAPGTIRYISPSADAQTRTFGIEIEIDDGEQVRDGMTAEARVELAPETAFRIAPSWLTLADNGTIGIRIVDGDDIVRFKEVRLVAQAADGFWITGPADGDRIITLGQEYVMAGEKVSPQPDDRIAALLGAASSGDN